MKGQIGTNEGKEARRKRKTLQSQKGRRTAAKERIPSIF
jgi:hypothetical protein